MIGQHKWKVILSSILILLPVCISLFVPETRVPRSVSLIFPLIILFTHWLALFFTLRDNRHTQQSGKVLNMIFWLCPAISLCTSGIFYAMASGMKPELGRLMPLMLGVLFIWTGNYMPKCRRNRTIGIRIIWTLASEENWERTHRLGGKVCVAAGLLSLMTVFLPGNTALIVLPALLLIAALIPIVYSWQYYKKQLRKGRADKAAYCQPDAKSDRITLIAALIITAVVCIACTVLCFTGNISVTYSDTGFTVDSVYYSAFPVEYADITAAEYRESSVPGERIFGFGTPRLLMGDFRSDEFGFYTRYSYTDSAAHVILTVRGETVVIGCADTAETKALYDAILAHTAEKTD